MKDWPAHIEEFRNRLFDDTDSFISSLSDALGEDRRSQMQMVQLDYLDYLEIKKKERAYQLIEYLTKAGKQYPPRYYFYAKEENGDLVQACNAEPTPLDSKFFPTIFSFPRLQEGFSDMPNHDQSMLIGLRMAQLVVSCTELILNKEVEFFDPLIAHELASICEILFGYERQVIYALLEEFAEFDLIQLNGGLYQIPIRRDDYVIRARPKLGVLLNTMIYDIAYLNLAAMRVPVAVDVLSSEEKNYGLFKAETLDQKRSLIDRESTMSGWIFAKTINSISLYRLVGYINDKQVRNIQDNFNKLKNDRHKMIVRNAMQGVDGREIGMFNVPSEMKNSIKSQLGGMLNVYSRDRGADALGRLLKRIANHFSDWDNYVYEY